VHRKHPAAAVTEALPKKVGAVGVAVHHVAPALAIDHHVAVIAALQEVHAIHKRGVHALAFHDKGGFGNDVDAETGFSHGRHGSFAADCGYADQILP